MQISSLKFKYEYYEYNNTIKLKSKSALPFTAYAVTPQGRLFKWAPPVLTLLFTHLICVTTRKKEYTVNNKTSESEVTINMDLNTSNVRGLASLDEREFSKIIYNIALSMGFSKERALQASKNTSFFRVLLKNASDRDLENMIGKVGKETLEDIYKSLPQNGAQSPTQ